MVKLSATAVSAIVVDAPVDNETPYSFARNNVPMSQLIGVAALKVETLSGSTKPEICTGSPIAREPSTSAGSDASDELELRATACAGNTARVNHPSGIRPPIAASGYVN